MRTRSLFSLSGLILAAVVALSLGGCKPSATSDAAGSPAAKSDAARPKYHCPMHPTYVSDRPGDCPICGMKLVPIKDGTAAAGHAGHADAGVPGRAPIVLSADKRQLIGLTLKKVEMRDLALTSRVPAIVQHDERRFARIAPRFGGWIRRLDANFTNAHVAKGGTLFTAYSPEVFATENDYLIAWRAARSLPAGASAPERAAVQALVDAARLRLSLWEIGDEEIRAIEQRGAPSAELEIRAPLSGHVVVKTAVEGRAFMAGETLFEIADLSHLWLMARVPESDLPRIAVGQEAMVTFPSLGNVVIDGKVSFIDPHIDPQTRRGMVRLELDNPDHRFSPEMWAEVEIEMPLGRKLVVPADAVIDTGVRQIAFVAGEKDHLEPRVVTIGARAGDTWEVREGLKEGDLVVSRALFLVDSESQLQAAIAGMGAAGSHQH